MGNLMEGLEMRPMTDLGERKSFYTRVRSAEGAYPIIEVLGPDGGFQKDEGIIYHLPGWEAPILRDGTILYNTMQPLEAQDLVKTFATEYFDQATILLLRDINYRAGERVIELFVTMEPDLAQYVMLTQCFWKTESTNIPALPLVVEQQKLFSIISDYHPRISSVKTAVILPFDFSSDGVRSEALVAQRKELFAKYVTEKFALRE